MTPTNFAIDIGSKAHKSVRRIETKSTNDYAIFQILFEGTQIRSTD